MKEISKVNDREEFSLIKFQPSALTLSTHDDLYQGVYVSKGFFVSAKKLFDLPYTWKNKRNIDRIVFSKKDTVFLFTEYELGNHYIVMKAKEKGAKVYIIDEGIGTYIINNYSKVYDNIRWKDVVINFLIGTWNGLNSSRFLIGSNNYFCRLDDRYYNGYILFHKLPINRDIPKIYIKFPGLEKNDLELDANSALILGGGLNFFYITDEEYIENILSICKGIRKSFRKIYFKFHHGELQESNKFVVETLKKVFIDMGITIINKYGPVELMISEYRPKFAIGHFSTALLNVFPMGCEPIFVHHMVNKKCVDFEIVTMLLKKMGYKFINSYEDINPSYHSGLKLDNVYCLDKEIKDFYKQEIFQL